MSVVNPLVAFYDIHGIIDGFILSRNRKPHEIDLVLFDVSVVKRFNVTYILT
jgi:hypothetical protein